MRRRKLHNEIAFLFHIQFGGNQIEGSHQAGGLYCSSRVEGRCVVREIGRGGEGVITDRRHFFSDICHMSAKSYEFLLPPRKEE